jgi:hypothetical protein
LSTRIEAAIRSGPGRRSLSAVENCDQSKSTWMEIVQIRRRTRFMDGLGTLHYQTPSVQYQTPDGKLIRPTKPTYISPTQPIASYSSSSHILWYNDVDSFDSTNAASASHTVELPLADARVLSSVNTNGSSSGPGQRKKSIPSSNY